MPMLIGTNGRRFTSQYQSQLSNAKWVWIPQIRLSFSCRPLLRCTKLNERCRVESHGRTIYLTNAASRCTAVLRISILIQQLVNCGTWVYVVFRLTYLITDEVLLVGSDQLLPARHERHQQNHRQPALHQHSETAVTPLSTGLKCSSPLETNVQSQELFHLFYKLTDTPKL